MTTGQKKFWHLGANFSVDLIVVQDGKALLIKRRNNPGKGKWAVPGGFQDTDARKGELWAPGKETASEAALRELQEETGIDPDLVARYLRPLGIFDRPGRDPRDSQQSWSVSRAFTLLLPDDLEVQVVAGSDASDAQWFSAKKAAQIDFAFDHRQMLEQAGFLVK